MNHPESDQQILDRSRRVLQHAHAQRSFDQSTLRQGLNSALNEEETPSRWPWGWWMGVAAAAGVVLMLGRTSPPDPLPPAVPKAERVALTPGTWRLQTFDLEVPESATVVWVEQTPLQMQLQAGALDIHPIADHSDEPLVVTTPLAKIRSVGAAYRVEALARRVILRVMRGTVEVESRHLKQGRMTVGPGEPLVVTERRSVSLLNALKRAPNTVASPAPPVDPNDSSPPKLPNAAPKGPRSKTILLPNTPRPRASHSIPKSPSRGVAESSPPSVSAPRDGSGRTSAPATEAESKPATEAEAKLATEAESKPATEAESKPAEAEPPSPPKAESAETSKETPPFDPAAVMDRADGLRRAQDWTRAATEYARVAHSKAPAMLKEEAAYRQSEILHRLGKDDAALSVLQRARRAHPQGHLRPERAALTAKIFFRKGQFAAALSALKGVRRAPISMHQLRLRIIEKLSEQDPKKARLALRHMLAQPLPSRLETSAKNLLERIERRL